MADDIAQPILDSLTGPLEDLPDPLSLPTLLAVRSDERFDLMLRPPGSKSITNRAMLVAALAGGRSMLHGALTDAVDTRVMAAALRTLGVGVEIDGTMVTVDGVGGRWRPAGVNGSPVRLDLENAGTAVRFLTAASVLSPVPIELYGSERMHERPIGQLVAAIGDLGARVEALGSPGCPPLRVHPPQLLRSNGEILFEQLPSSQFVSAIMLLGAFMPGGLAIEIEGEVTSSSYIRMTLGLLDLLGVPVRASANMSVLRIGAGADALAGGFELDIEPDASGASAFWAAAASINGAEVTVQGVDEDGLQGDLAFPAMLARMGATAQSIPPEASPTGPSLSVRGGGSLKPVMADMRDMPDAAMALVVLAGLAEGGSMLRGLHTLRVKETDRLHALMTELAKVGITLELDVHGEPGAVRIEPPPRGLDRSPSAEPVVFETYNDHRMAMALSIIALHRPNVSIADPICVAKTYPGFWQDLARLYAS